MAAAVCPPGGVARSRLHRDWPRRNKEDAPDVNHDSTDVHHGAHDNDTHQCDDNYDHACDDDYDADAFQRDGADGAAGL
jgi:hypothetical protein